MTELDAFRGAENKLGVSIWRIENFKPVAQPTTETGDSYIVLNGYERNGSKNYNLHFWLGKETTKDESGTAAFLSGALDEMLGGVPVQYRELQGEESETFLQLFKNGVHYEAGGVSSGFSKVEAEKHVTRLLHVRGTRGVRVAEVPVKLESLNHGDCFVLDDGVEIFQWNGKAASSAEKAKALNVTASIRNECRKGKAMVYVLDDGDFDSEHAKHFFGLLGVKTPATAKISDSVSRSAESLFQPAKLYKVEGLAFTEVAGSEGGLQRTDLASNSPFVLSTAGKIYVWLGSGVPAEVKKKAIEIGTTFLEKQKLPSTLQIQVVKEKLEPPMFKQNFQKWQEQELKAKVSEAKTKQQRAEVDIAALVQGATAEATKQMAIDDGSGTAKVWRVENYSLVDWPEDQYGHFYAGDSYVVKYTFMKSGSENAIIYYWQGRDSSTDEKGASALLASKLDEEMGGAPTQVRLVQNKEPDHFFQIFHGGVIVHLGGLNNEDEGKQGPNGERLFQIKGYNAHDTHAVQVRTAAASLNSGDSFVLIDNEGVFVWHGKLCSDEERAFAVTMANKLANDKTTAIVEEGEEREGFWARLGGEADYPNVGDLPPPTQPARLFQISDSATGGMGIVAEEIFDFDQEDLCDEDIMILDAYNEIFVWIGHLSRENEKKEAVELAKRYLAELHKQSGRDVETPISQVLSGKEPPTFTCHFLGWDDTRAAEFEDPYTAKLKAMVAQAKDDSELTKLAAERRKRFVDPLAEKKPGNSTPQAPVTPPAETETTSAAETEALKFQPLVHFFPLEELKAMKSESGIDVTRKEDYLSDADFAEAMGMSRQEFRQLAAWRKKQKKQEIGIF